METQNTKTLEERVKKIVAGVFRIDENKITPQTKFIEDLHAKSIDTIALIAALEGEFNIKIPPQEVQGNKTIQEAIDYLKTKLG